MFRKPSLWEVFVILVYLGIMVALIVSAHMVYSTGEVPYAR